MLWIERPQDIGDRFVPQDALQTNIQPLRRVMQNPRFLKCCVFPVSAQLHKNGFVFEDTLDCQLCTIDIINAVDGSVAKNVTVLFLKMCSTKLSDRYEEL